ncbi:P-loop containing nucleoside triphosphate hydrolase protein [Ilyonectria destructans]|nr:P-loop containing nucleoside triphosphate hydrolase protein [Ilyonectria destructans]
MNRYVDLASTSLQEIEDVDTRLPLDAIDRLRYLQLGDVAKLPQIIVVGDRSSGKSSILHAISGIEFPIDNDLGTRFTTELIFRRAKSHCTLVQVIPGDDSECPNPSLISFEWPSFVKSSILEIIDEAIQRMGLPKSKLSRDILRIEVCSPKLAPLTLIDLPGFVQPSSGLQEERILVDKIAKRYIKQPNSIILVASAANCAVNSGALQTARRYDRTGERTFGIITKPDLLNEESKTELHLHFSRYVAKLPNLPRGWHVLRNRSRNERLRKTLNDVLVGHTENKLQQLIETIQSNMLALEAQQTKLTSLRMNSEEVRTYLTGTADGFHQLALDAIHGRYTATSSSSLHDSEMKPRRQIQNFNRAFRVTMSTKGASRVIQQDGERDWNVKDGSDHSSKDEEVRETKQTQYLDPLQPFLDLYDFSDPEPISESTLKSQLEQLAAVNQGTGFSGIPNHEIAIGLFKTQSKPWKAIAERHIENVTSYAKTFVERLLKHVLGSDDRTEKALLEHVVTPFFRKRGEQMRVKLEEILQPYSDGYSMPDDAEFQDSLSRRSVQDLMDRVVDRFSELNTSTSTYKNQINSLELNAALRMLANVEMSRSCNSTAEKTLRMATAHYEISRRSFTQHIVNLVVESCLVRKIPGMFTAKSVAQLD